DSYFESLKFSPDGRYLAISRYKERDGNVRLYNLDEERWLTFNYPKGVQELAWSGNSQFLAVAGLTDIVQIYDVSSEMLTQTLVGNGNWHTSVAFSPDLKRIATASPVGEIRFWRFPGGESAGKMAPEKGVRRVRFSSDGNSLFWASMGGEVGVWDAVPDLD
ncbi:MAG: hypothetical protein NXI32_30525, partial [bacterium]|nr:hypothetical protein [bacterium]